jgi:ubiquinone/menaquinone biosynthesis C-methylase UbiE
MKHISQEANQCATVVVVDHRSASVYEFSTETLFFGRQDAMQRTTLLPLAQHIRERGLDPGAMRVMEACCGTGRFHTFLKVNMMALI